MPPITPANVLSGLPASLREPLLKSYQEIAANYSEHRWEPSELNGGKFCEVVYTIVHGSLTGTFASKPSKPRNMVDGCRALEGITANPNRVGDRSLRLLIPRMLPVLYEIRNNRGVGHVGGDVDPNFLDATAVYGMSSWCLAELVRIFHSVSTEVAQQTVDALIERKHPLIWQVGDIRRVLNPGMNKRDQALVLLHQSPAWVSDRNLASWVEYSSVSMFQRRILGALHKARLIEHDRAEAKARISPLGIKMVEEKILKSR